MASRPLTNSSGAHRWKESGEQVDNRVVEVVWDKENEVWRKERFRDDKVEGNYKDVVNSILISIRDGVEKSVVSLEIE